MCRIKNCILLIVKDGIIKLLTKHKFFFPLLLCAHVLGLGDCVRSTAMVQLTAPWSVNPLSDFSNCQLMLWPLITWPCTPYTVLSQLNADSCEISLRKLSPRWVEERKSPSLEEKILKIKSYYCSEFKEGKLTLPFAITNYMPG